MKTLKYLVPLALIIGALILIAQTGRQEKASPNAPGTVDGKEMLVRETTPVTPPQMNENLQIESVNTVLLTEKSVIGKAGDLLLVFNGSGFMATSLNPVVVIGEKTFDETIISADFRQLFVVVDPKTKSALQKGAFDLVEVRNPDRKFVRVSFKQLGITERIPRAAKGALVYDEKGMIVLQ